MLKIKVDIERITLDDVIALEERASLKTMRDIIDRFTVGEDGNYLDFPEAVKVVGAIKMSDLKEVSKQFADAMKGVAAEALPPTGSGG